MTENFEVLRYITIGQYLPGTSPVHRIDPAIKLLATVILVLTVALTGALMPNLVLLGLAVGLTLLAGVPLGFALGGIRPAAGIIGALLLLELLFSPGTGITGGAVLWHWGFIHVTTGSLLLAGVSLMRLLDFLLLVSLFTLTTRLADVTRAVERLLAPFQRIGVPAREFALILTIALRFVPTFALELERLMKAQASRGGGLTGVPRWNLWAQARARVPVIVPLFLVALHRAEELALAMEARGYAPYRERSRYRQYRIRPEDWIVLGAVGIVAAGILLL
jgi:energy-coupling factor transport system permease protein